MFHPENPQDTRQVFFQSWAKFRTNKPLTPLENQIVAVIRVHPEYHALLENERTLQDFIAEEGEPNPFLHLGLHLVIRDQVSTNRPEGITALYQRLCEHFATDSLQTEHFIMDHLAHCLWEANRHQTMPDFERYLQRLHSATEAL